ncbi:unnamed protein product [Calypogeia fissa]
MSMDRAGGGSSSSIVPFHANGFGDSNGNGSGNGHLSSSSRQKQMHHLQQGQPVVNYSLRHGLSGVPRIRIAWGVGNHIRLSFLANNNSNNTSNNINGNGGEQRKEAGKVVELALGPEVQDGAEERRIAAASVPFFASLQNQRSRLVGSLSDEFGPGDLSNWWENVLDYSRSISKVLENGGSCSSSKDSAPRRLEDSAQESKPTSTTWAIWDLLEIFYVDKRAEGWLAERLVEWLLTHGAAFTVNDKSLKSMLVGMKQNLSKTLFPEDESYYWEAIASALSVGWLDFVVKLLRFHGSYRHDQIDDRQTENGLVEAVAVLVSKMPRLRARIPYGEPGIAYKFKPEFAKEWERWRMQVSKLDRSTYWNECHHKGTLYGLRKLLEILQGNNDALNSSTSHWIELLVAKFLHVRPFSNGTEWLLSLARECIDSKGRNSSTTDTLRPLILAIMGEDTEIVISECAKHFEPWLTAHMVDLLKARNVHAENVLQKESGTQSGISLEELYRLSYAQSLASHPLTWQLAPQYLAACPRQGLGMLETLLLSLPVSGDNRLALKALEICRLYELTAVGTVLSRKVGVHHWKHGLNGAAIVWLQRANDSTLLSSLSDQLLASVSTGSSFGHAQTLEQMQGLVDLLGSEFQATTGGLSFLQRYKDFKSALQVIREMRSRDADKQKMAAAGRQAATCLTELFKAGITPKRFWMPLLRDSVELLEWPDQVLLSTVETNLLLNCTQELRLAKLCGDVDNVELTGPAIDRVRLALATNLSRSLVQV